MSGEQNNTGFLGRSSGRSFPSVGVWLFVAACWITLVIYLGWQAGGNSFDAEQARLHPVAVARIIFSQLSRAEALSDWNIPYGSLAFTGAWLVAVWMVGCASVRRLMGPSIPICCSMRALLSFAFGLTLFGLLQLGAGFSGQFWLDPVVVFAFGGVVLFAVNGRDRQAILEFPKAAWWQWVHADWWTRSVGVLLMLAALSMVVPALTPPIQSDAVRYHLGAPQEYLKNGFIGYLPHNAYSNMPFLIEMSYVSALLHRAPESAQLMHLSLALFAGLGVYAVARQLATFAARETRRGAGIAPEKRVTGPAELLPALLYFSTPMAAVLASWPFTDHGISLMLLASMAAGMVCISRAGVGAAAWAVFGVCLGGLIGTKYTMAPVALVLFLAAAVPALFRDRLDGGNGKRSLIAGPAVGAIASLITGGVWFLKNWILIGNPVYPFAGSFFHGGEWSAQNDAFLQARAGLKGFGHSLTALLELPYHATFYWTRFEAHNPGAAIWLAMFCVIAGAAELLRLRTNAFVARARGLVLIGLIAAFATWFYSYQSNRLLLPVIAVALSFAPWSVLDARRLASRAMAGAGLLYALTGLAWAVQWSWVATALSPQPLPYLLGRQSRAAYVQKSLSYAAAFSYVNKHAGSQTRVLLVGEHRIYGARFHAIWSDWFDTPALVWILRHQHISTLDELLQYLRENGIDWILINERELEPQLERDFRPWFKPQEWRIFEELRKVTGDGIDVKHFPPGVTVIHLEALVP